MAISAKHTAFTTTDYISAMPADDLINLAVKKQQMYDEGVAQVQQGIDAYSKIRTSLVRDVDKQYFDKAMQDYVKAINQSAGLDFSDKANVQAVLNIGKPLESDSNLINAVESSANYRKRMENLSTVDQKYRSPSNDDLFFAPMAAWKESGDLKTKLDYDTYKPYQEGVVTKYAEIIDKLKPNIETYMERTPDGRYIQKTKISSVDAPRIREAYLTNLTPAEQEQLQIDARYRLKNSDPMEMASGYLGNMKSMYDANGLRIQDLETKLSKGKATLNPADPTLANIQNELNKARLQQEVLSKKAFRDPSQVEQGELMNYLIEDTVNNAANAYAYQQAEKDLDDDPYALASYQSQLKMQEEKFKAQLEGTGSLPWGYSATDNAFLSDTQSVAPGTGDKKQSNLNLLNTLVAGLPQDEKTQLQVQNGILALSTANGKPLSVGDTIKRISMIDTWDPQDRKEIEAMFPSKEKFNTWVGKVKQIAGGMFDVKDYRGDTVDINSINARSSNMNAVPGSITGSYQFVPKADIGNVYVVAAHGNTSGYAPYSLSDFLQGDGINLTKLIDIRKDVVAAPN